MKTIQTLTDLNQAQLSAVVDTFNFLNSGIFDCDMIDIDGPTENWRKTAEEIQKAENKVAKRVAAWVETNQDDLDEDDRDTLYTLQEVINNYGEGLRNIEALGSLVDYVIYEAEDETPEVIDFVESLVSSSYASSWLTYPITFEEAEAYIDKAAEIGAPICTD